MKFISALWLAIFLFAGCSTGLAVPATASASASRHFTGVYVNGWEAQIFVENGQDEQSYWVEMTPEARAAITAVLPEANAPSAARVLVEFEGRLSQRGRYGHLGAFPYIVLIEHVTSARLEQRPLAQ